ncbi:MAG: anhydro-N-acetylmuramic acid kinase [Alphaproteobacteria bacterium]
MTVDAPLRDSAETATNRLHLAIGLMSGTSLDGVDAALIRSDGRGQVERLGGLSVAYDEAFRQKLKSILGRQDRHDPEVTAVAAELTRRHADAVNALLRAEGLEADDIHVIGFHGQTIHHAPDKGVTVQIGDGPALARATGIQVVCDFRSADVAAGGEGAPLAPLYHQALTSVQARPLAVVNIGGVGNITFIGEGEDHVIAFDTGPGNALIDDLVQRETGRSIDEDGKIAAAGRADQVRLGALLDNPYFAVPPPKSLDRDAFEVSELAGLSLEDAAATLTAFTAHSIARGLEHLPVPPARMLVTGGGRHNPTLMAMLSSLLTCPIAPMEEIGADGDLLEAECFGWLALRSLAGLPLSVPGTTGVPQPQTGGMVCTP